MAHNIVYIGVDCIDYNIRRGFNLPPRKRGLRCCAVEMEGAETHNNHFSEIRESNGSKNFKPPRFLEGNNKDWGIERPRFFFKRGLDTLKG